VRYEQFYIRKKTGGLRVISAPISAIKLIQRKLSQVLYSVYTPKAPVHGFVPSRSIVTNAQQHVRKRYVFNIDLADFFGSIHFGRVRGVFMNAPYNLPADVSTVLAQICCLSNKLPQGAPTSPVVSNMICARLDSQLRLLAKEKHCTYTRYADDITFSTRLTKFPRDIAYRDQEDSILVGKRLLTIIEGNDFKVNWKKVRLQHKNCSQEVTGLTVNQFPNVDRRFIRKISSMLHVWDKYGLFSARIEYQKKRIKELKEFQPELSTKELSKMTFPLFEDVLKGKINFLGMIRGKDDPLFLKYLGWYRALARR
jgi:RNA-directed DNA polymerase